MAREAIVFKYSGQRQPPLRRSKAVKWKFIARLTTKSSTEWPEENLIVEETLRRFLIILNNNRYQQ